MSYKEYNSIFNTRSMLIDFEYYGMNNFLRLGRINYNKASFPLEMHSHPNTIEICYLAKGKQSYVVDDKEYSISGGDVFWTLPNEIHGTGSYPEEKAILYWLLIEFNKSESNNLGITFSEADNIPIKLLSMKNRIFKGDETLHNLLDEVFIYFFSDNQFKRIAFTNLLTLFLIKIIECENKNTRKDISSEILSILYYIDKNLVNNIKISDIADNYYLSKSSFIRKFSSEIGMPPGEYIIRKKIELAQQMLLNSNASITKIAYDLNFSSSQYFSTVFKRITSKRPCDFILKK